MSCQTLLLSDRTVQVVTALYPPRHSQASTLPLPGLVHLMPPCMHEFLPGQLCPGAEFLCWLLSAPETCWRIPVTDLLENCTCCHTRIEVADQTSYLTQSQYTDTAPTSPSTDPITSGTWQGSYYSTSYWYDSTGGKSPTGKAGFDPGSATLEADTYH